MTAIKRYEVLYNTSAQGTGAWFRLDTRYEETCERALQVFVTTGDTVTIEGTTKDVRGSTEQLVTASIAADEISTLKSFTANGAENLTGPWTYIRVTKTGVNGPAKVLGFI